MILNNQYLIENKFVLFFLIYEQMTSDISSMEEVVKE